LNGTHELMMIIYSAKRDLGMTVTNQNYIHEEIKNGLKLGNAYYHSLQIQIVLYGCETWSLT